MFHLSQTIFCFQIWSTRTDYMYVYVAIAIKGMTIGINGMAIANTGMIMSTTGTCMVIAVIYLDDHGNHTNVHCISWDDHGNCWDCHCNFTLA